MTFGIDTNTRTPDAGVVQGRQKEGACECWFSSKGKIIPLLLKVEDEDGEIRVIKEITVHSPARLIYYVTQSRWVLNYR